ncbi:MAG: hypothetical protein NT162_00280 [Candidatus Woesebacteria bacterium]|nr:hypothetical protein [Candidatus Woesebacteria bacterium]
MDKKLIAKLLKILKKIDVNIVKEMQEMESTSFELQDVIELLEEKLAGGIE